ncbi:hypothetical protein FOMPIDRAFT_1059916 [Fomitopsis schrenkii]|uniref:SnoaL-like domain-containing protein n=1 Tax=Fomitopsis schrenkii TaxID=2126942 RepID=S8FIN6_FOMSC|nr:hypothetical protein FOMPIDRAFT_1059916 [Fomitopsis schrenkii]
MESVPSISLYAKLRELALAHAQPDSVEQILSIRHPSAIHAWGHNNLVQRNPGLQDRMDNAAFARHLASTGRYITNAPPGETVHDVIVDEWKRVAVVRMSYYLQAKKVEGKEAEDSEVVENDLIWTLKFTQEAEQETSGLDGVRIIESVEYIDASASARLGTLVRAQIGGEIGDDVRGGIVLKE